MPSYIPTTLDGTINPLVPRSEGMSPADATASNAASTAFRNAVMVFSTSLTGRALTVTAVRCPPGRVLFDFGDKSPPVFVDVVTGGAAATHTYAADGVYDVTIESYPTVPAPLAPRDRFSENVPINWPAAHP